MALCPGNCSFCAFGKNHTHFQNNRISENEFITKVTDFCKEGDLYGLYLMAMHEYDLDFYLKIIRQQKKW